MYVLMTSSARLGRIVEDNALHSFLGILWSMAFAAGDSNMAGNQLKVGGGMVESHSHPGFDFPRGIYVAIGTVPAGPARSRR